MPEIMEQAAEPEPAAGQEPAPAIERDTVLPIIIELIQKRIRTHQNLLSGNRKRTDLALIYPILDLMDWDTSDPDLVIPEHYGNCHALVWNSRPVALLATHGLHTKRANQTQHLNYCKQELINYIISTDGDRWQVKSVLHPQRQTINAHPASQTAPEAADNIEQLFRTINRTWRR